MSQEILDLAKSWLRADPDPTTRDELDQLINSNDLESLTELFDGNLLFGTAGLRAELGSGPLRMNRVLVQLVTRALFHTLKEYVEGESTNLKIVVGYDARQNSNVFAWDAVGVIEECGGTALLIDQPLPTPVLAHSVIQQSCDAGIMVTASHNPREDNGYKVYWSDGGQITSPHDRLVEQKLSKLIKEFSSDYIKDYKRPKTEISASALTEYVNCLVEHIPAEPVKDLKLVYTPLHGVGKSVIEEVFEKFNFPKPLVVPEQGEPDGKFPTTAFPNPEEAGTLDLALALAKESKADLLLANDPDADRLCVCLPEENDEWRTLTGNELGVLLADYCMNSYLKAKENNQTKALVATTCVSSQLLSKMAKANDIVYEETLTGFKWICRADKDVAESTFLFGYEEALGYGVLLEQIRDKDGISAAVAFVNLFAQLQKQGKTPFDRLEELNLEYGMHLTSTASIRYEGTGQEKAAAAMGLLRSQLPEQIGNKKVLDILDYSSNKKQRPSNMISFYLEGDTRIVIRPSGTEPKLKVYAELVEKDISKKQEAEKELLTLIDAAAKLVSKKS